MIRITQDMKKYADPVNGRSFHDMLIRIIDGAVFIKLLLNS